jgi:Protein of unknown function (DUF3606)
LGETLISLARGSAYAEDIVRTGARYNMTALASNKRYVIDITKPWHVAWWAAELGVSDEALLDIIDIVGNQAHAVEYYLAVREAREQRELTTAVPDPDALTIHA